MALPAAPQREEVPPKLIRSGPGTDFVAFGRAGGFFIEPVPGLNGTTVGILGEQRKGSRAFTSATPVCILRSHLRNLRIECCTVDAAKDVPDGRRSARLDRAAALNWMSQPNVDAEAGKN